VPAAAEDKAAMLLPGSINDQSWNALGYSILVRLKSRGFMTPYTENVTDADEGEAMRGFARGATGTRPFLQPPSGDREAVVTANPVIPREREDPEGHVPVRIGAFRRSHRFANGAAASWPRGWGSLSRRTRGGARLFCRLETGRLWPR
jgi:hypothetical protein